MQPIMERMMALGIAPAEMARAIGKDAWDTARLLLCDNAPPPAMDVVERMAEKLGWTPAELIEKGRFFQRQETTLYWCDWRRNWKCKKSMCAYAHGPEWARHGCKKTKDPMFAMRDEHGDAMKAPFFRKQDGGAFHAAEPAEEAKQGQIERFLDRVRQKCEQRGKATDWIDRFLASE